MNPTIALSCGFTDVLQPLQTPRRWHRCEGVEITALELRRLPIKFHQNISLCGDGPWTTLGREELRAGRLYKSRAVVLFERIPEHPAIVYFVCLFAFFRWPAKLAFA